LDEHELPKGAIMAKGRPKRPAAAETPAAPPHQANGPAEPIKSTHQQMNGSQSDHTAGDAAAAPPAGQARARERRGRRPAVVQGGSPGRQPRDIRDAEAVQAGPGPAPAVPAVPRCLTGAEIVAQPVEWEWPGRVQCGAVGMIGGDTGAGKSTVLAAIAAAVTNGCPLPGREDRVLRRVGIIAPEEDHGTLVVPRLAAAGADLSRVAFLEQVRGPRRRRFKLPSGRDAFLKVIKQEELGGLVIDPASSLLDDPRGQNDAGAVREFIDCLLDVSWEAGVWIWMTRPFRKDARGLLIHRFTGSAEWGNAPRFVLAVVPDLDRKGGKLLVVLKVTSGRPAPTLRFDLEGAGKDVARCSWVGLSNRDAEDLAEEEGDAGERGMKRDAKAHLVARLDEADAHEARVKALEDEAIKNGITPRSLRKAKEELGCTSRQLRDTDGSYWVWGKPAQGWPK
jgi:putative DNA primase/helicase